jgi:hypothetical protein
MNNPMLHPKLLLVIALASSLVLGACSDNENTSSSDQQVTKTVDKQKDSKLKNADKASGKTPQKKNETKSSLTQIKHVIPKVLPTSIELGTRPALPPPLKVENPDTHSIHHTLIIPDTGQVGVSVSFITGNNNQEFTLKSIKNKKFFIAYNLPLQRGRNEFTVKHYGSDEVINKNTVFVTSTATNSPFIEVSGQPDVGYNQLETTLSVNSPIAASRYLFDFDGDGLIDIESTTSSIKHTYKAIGSFKPRITIEGTNGLSYTTTDEQSSVILVKALPSVEIKDLIKEDVVDIELHDNKVFALTKNMLYHFPVSAPLKIEKIKVNGLSKPQGFGIDKDGNVYIANTGRHQIIKLRKDDDYKTTKRTLMLGKKGKKLGELNKPIDISITKSKSNNRLYVLDGGNNRVQVLTDKGSYLEHFDASLTKNGSFNSPLNIVNAPNFIISDSGNRQLRQFNYINNQYHESSLYTGKTIGKVTGDSPEFMISDEGQINVVQRFDGIVKEIPITATTRQALDMDNGLYSVIDSKTGYLSIIKDPLLPDNATAQAVIEQFIAAVIAGDQQKMLNLSGGKKEAARALVGRLPLFQVALSNLINLEVIVNNEFAVAKLTFPYNKQTKHVELDMAFNNGIWQVL